MIAPTNKMTILIAVTLGALILPSDAAGMGKVTCPANGTYRRLAALASPPRYDLYIATGFLAASVMERNRILSINGIVPAALVNQITIMETALAGPGMYAITPNHPNRIRRRLKNRNKKGKGKNKTVKKEDWSWSGVVETTLDSVGKVVVCFTGWAGVVAEFIITSDMFSSILAWQEESNRSTESINRIESMTDILATYYEKCTPANGCVPMAPHGAFDFDTNATPTLSGVVVLLKKERDATAVPSKNSNKPSDANAVEKTSDAKADTSANSKPDVSAPQPEAEIRGARQPLLEAHRRL